MKSKIFLTIISAILIPPVHLLVITRFNQETMGDYYYALQKFTNDNRTKDFENIDLHEYCHSLRQSKIFRATSTLNEMTFSNFSSKVYTIDKHKLQMEKDQVQLNRTKLEVHSLPIQEKPSFACLDPEGDMRYIVTESFVPQSSFLYLINPNIHFIRSREIRTSSKTIPILVAVVDESSKRTIINIQGGRRAIINKFIESVQSTNFNDTDDSCNINRILQYRLCAIAGDALKPSLISFLDDPLTSVQYIDQLLNLYYEPEDREENCQRLTIDVSGNYTGKPKHLKIITRKMLRCFLNTVTYAEGRKSYKFYLSINTLESPTVYLFQQIQRDRQPDEIRVQELAIPLLKYLHTYKMALKDYNI